jgi:lipopolysaccharide transport system ATP-binding protein
MSDAAILVESLSKRYLLGHQSARGQSYTALRDVLAREVRNFARSAADLLKGRQIIQGDEVEEFWALRDVSFDVKCGEVLGIIGPNGAGKSTLFKVLSRITEPTRGRIQLNGRVASLLEVGTGFHPELSGRENIYLNGAILGMTRADIRKRFDEIVAFAEIERFLDTPVKRYSSGMYVRLAFAVAAHLEPDTLIVDEVLAVGDAEFQKKCVGKMEEVSRTSGRTVLFVSHNMAAVRALCDRGLLLRGGQIACAGPIDVCIDEYERSVLLVQSAEWTRPPSSDVNELGFEWIRSAVIGRQPDQILRIECEFKGSLCHEPAMVAFDIADENGRVLMQALPAFSPLIRLENGGRFRFDVQLPPIIPGEYWITAWTGPPGATFDWQEHCISFEIRESPSAGRPYPHPPDHGFLAPRCTYELLGD